MNNILYILITIFVSGCLNQGGSTSRGNRTAASTSPPTSSPGSTVGNSSEVTFTLIRGNVTPGTTTTSSGGSGSGSGGSTTPSTTPTSTTTNPTVFTLVFNADNASQNIGSFCQVQSQNSQNTARACLCRYNWTETNSSDGSAITRTVETPLTDVTGFQVQCNAPPVYDSEIIDGTTLRISVVPHTAVGHPGGFVTNTLEFRKQAVAAGATSDFRDAEGRIFYNITHYVCFDKFQKDLQIDHSVKNAGTNPTTNQAIQAQVANHFTTSSGGQPVSFSAQSYYYDFYVRSNTVGSINAGSSNYQCPRVNIGGVQRFYPFDSQFALALQAAADFPIPVQGLTILGSSSSGSSSGGTSNVGGSTSGGGSSSSGGSGGTNSASGVIGYAARPNADGTCPAFRDSTGRLKRTFRLRQYRTVYPLRYQADGNIIDNSQPINVVYVMDRPVDKANQDPLKPITRLGPKPCPFSFLTAQLGRKCSSDASISGINIDGTEIPSNASCPIYPPPPTELSAYKPNGALVIRPFQAFTPHFVENTNFRACTFQSAAPVDPELVLVRDDSVFGTNGPKDFYCAKHYPSAGAIVPENNDGFNKAPGDCDLTSTATAIKLDRTYSCGRTYDPSSSSILPPSAGCCQICAGTDCASVGAGNTPTGRNAVFSPPANTGNPSQAVKILPRAVPNQLGGGGCFDPSED